jgi:hypothetical protein
MISKIKLNNNLKTQTALDNINKAVDAYVDDLDSQCLQGEISEEYLELKMQEIHKSLNYITEIVSNIK